MPPNTQINSSPKMVPIYEPMSDRQKDYNALRGLSIIPKIQYSKIFQAQKSY
jgi:hypothetical protein